MTNTTNTETTQETDTCKNCKYWFKVQNEAAETEGALIFGRCKRNPPLFVQKDDTTYTGFPMIVDHEWCGEFIPKQ